MDNVHLCLGGLENANSSSLCFFIHKYIVIQTYKNLLIIEAIL